jgi:hypothetical protein
MTVGALRPSHRVDGVHERVQTVRVDHERHVEGADERAGDVHGAVCHGHSRSQDDRVELACDIEHRIGHLRRQRLGRVLGQPHHDRRGEFGLQHPTTDSGTATVT